MERWTQILSAYNILFGIGNASDIGHHCDRKLWLMKIIWNTKGILWISTDVDIPYTKLISFNIHLKINHTVWFINTLCEKQVATTLWSNPI